MVQFRILEDQAIYH